MKREYLPLLLSLTLTTTLLATTARAEELAAEELAADEALFTLNLPRITYTEKMKLTVVRSADGVEGEKEINNLQNKVKIKRRWGGYKVLVTPLSHSITKGAQVVKSPITEILLKQRFTFKIGKDGEIKEALGFDKFYEDVKQIFPKELMNVYNNFFAPDTLIAKEKRQWNERITSYLGKKVKKGDRWAYESEYLVPRGKLNYYTIVEIEDIEKKDKKTLVTIKYSYSSNAKDLGKLAKDVIDELPIEEGKAIELSGAKLSGGGKRIIDANTMLIYYEELEKVISFELELPDGSSSKLSRSENKIYEFDHNRQIKR